jgi:hypothetical protein
VIDPRTTRLFHITAIGNLAETLKAGALLAKSQVDAKDIAYQNIAYQGAQGARATRAVCDPPGGVVHDYVPFYFAPRSPMLRAIEGGKVEGCTWRQVDIVHFETTIEGAISGEKPFVFDDRNATLAWSKPYVSLNDLDKVAWDLLTETPRLDGFCKYWHNVPSKPRYADRMERRQAEFLVHGSVELTRFTRIGVINPGQRDQVRALCANAGVPISVEVVSDWYF